MASRSKIARRRWSETFKKRVVKEASQPGTTLADVAHRYDLDPRRISIWKAKFDTGTSLVPVDVTGLNDPSVDQEQRPGTMIEINLPCGTTLRCGPETNRDLVAEILATLRSTR